jgi:hypothetical protein
LLKPDVLTILAVVTRARGARFQRALTQTDLLEPPGRRCGCWSTSPFRFSGLLVVWFGATMEFGRSAPAALDSNQLRGHLQQIENSAALTVAAAPPHRIVETGWLSRATP